MSKKQTQNKTETTLIMQKNEKMDPVSAPHFVQQHYCNIAQYWLGYIPLMDLSHVHARWIWSRLCYISFKIM